MALARVRCVAGHVSTAEELPTGTPRLLARLEDGVAVVTLNHDARRNALGDDLTPFLRQACPSPAQSRAEVS